MALPAVSLGAGAPCLSRPAPFSGLLAGQQIDWNGIAVLMAGKAISSGSAQRRATGLVPPGSVGMEEPSDLPWSPHTAGLGEQQSRNRWPVALWLRSEAASPEQPWGEQGPGLALSRFAIAGWSEGGWNCAQDP